MATTRSPEVPDTSLSRDILRTARYYLGGRRGLLLLAAFAVVAGLTSNWSWLVAAGIAPLLLAALPCVAMCALGICMNRSSGRSCSTEAASRKMTELSVEDTSRPAPSRAQDGELRRGGSDEPSAGSNS